MGRWQKGRDLQWFTKAHGSASIDQSALQAELAAVKAAEEERRLVALGIKPLESLAAKPAATASTAPSQPAPSQPTLTVEEAIALLPPELAGQPIDSIISELEQLIVAKRQKLESKRQKKHRSRSRERRKSRSRSRS